MANTIANVLVGVATLGVRSPGDAYAEWVTAQHQLGDYSVALVKTGSGDPGSTHVQFTPISTTIKFSEFCADVDTGAPTDYSYYHKESVVTSNNWTQMELKFEDPDSDGWVEITAVRQSVAGGLAWAQEVLGQTTKYGCGGNTPDGSSVFEWGSPLENMAGIEAKVQGYFQAVEAGSETQLLNYILTRIRIELWEPTGARTCWVDSAVIDGTAHPIEIGSVTPGLSLSSPFTDVGYTEDGVTIEYTGDTADIEVEEETFPIDRVITKETVQITCNMAESTLTNISNAMAGAVLSGSILTLGAGVNKELNFKIAGINPAGKIREIFVPRATATGAVGMSYKKGEKTVVPVTFQALKPTTGHTCTIVDNVA